MCHALGYGANETPFNNMSLKDYIIARIVTSGKTVPTVKIAENMNEAEALLLENSFIDAIGAIPNGPLVNARFHGADVLYVDENRIPMMESLRGLRQYIAKDEDDV